MIDFLIDVIAYIVILFACDIKRRQEDKIKLFTPDWAIQALLILIASFILKRGL